MSEIKKLQKKLQKKFPNKDIQFESFLTDVGNKQWSIIIDGKKLRIAVNDWCNYLDKIFGVNIENELFKQVVSEIKIELKK